MVKTTAHLGFTLIELMLSVSIVAILFSAGINAYIKGQRSQQISAAAESMLTLLQAAQKKSLIGDKDCTGALQGYEVKYSAGGSTLTTSAKCLSASGSPQSNAITNISFVSSGNILFKPLGAGIDTGAGSTANLDFRYGGANTVYRIVIDKTGSITYEGKQ